MLARCRQAFRRHPFFGGGALLMLALFPLTLSKTAAWAERSALDQIEERARRTLDLARASLSSELRRHEAVPQLLAIDRTVIRFLASERLPGNVHAMNRTLAAINKIAGSADTYLMDTTGLTLAASNWNSERPFVGRNFGYRPYFTDALGGTLGRYFALGTTSQRRGYYFAAPVREGAAMLGVVAVKVDITPIERAWAASAYHLLASDGDGVVFMSSRPEWVLHSLGPLAPEVRDRIATGRRYDGMAIEALDVRASTPHGSSAELLTIADDRRREQRFLTVSAVMPESDWTLRVLADSAPVAAQVRRAVATAAFAFAFAVLLIALLVQRRLRIQERLESTALARLELEHRVRERTVDLTNEVAERRAAEEELRRTQRELIQASKLSALGEMSAGISHELNQPLAAIRSFAENAEEYLERGRGDEARANLARIGALTERMARIISDLRTFARKDSEAPGSVSLDAVIGDAFALLDARIRSRQVSVARPHLDGALCVRADGSRLQQVVVNIVANALDAMGETAAPALRVSVDADPEQVRLRIRDNGPGIAPERIHDIFDPFFTTKDVDQGLGLGLSISYGIIAGFGGSIQAENEPDGGATFTVTLPRAEDASVRKAVAHGR